MPAGSGPMTRGRKSTRDASPKDSTAATEQLAGFLARFTPEVRAIAQGALDTLRGSLPGAFELVYDNYNALVVAFGPSDRTSDVVFSVALYPRWVNLFFARGAFVSDPDRLLKGTGSTIRSVRLTSAFDLNRPEIHRLVNAALEEARWEPTVQARGRMIVKSISAKQRARVPRGA
jgi:hypothetical protein